MLHQPAETDLQVLVQQPRRHDGRLRVDHLMQHFTQLAEQLQRDHLLKSFLLGSWAGTVPCAPGEPSATNSGRKYCWIDELMDCIALRTHTHDFLQVSSARPCF